MAIDPGHGVRVPAPRCEPTSSGLLAVAEVVNLSEATFGKGVEWDETTCDYDPPVVSGQCPPLPEQRKTTARGFDTNSADAFVIYAGWECNTMEADDAWDRSDELFEKGWRRSLERAMWTGLDQDGNTIEGTLATVVATDLTPAGGALDVTSGVATIESYMADCSDCEPILHANRGLFQYIAERGLLDARSQDALRLWSGTKIAAGGGYSNTGPGGVDPDPGEAWMFATGGVRVILGPKFFTPDRGDLAAAVDRQKNDITVFTERFATIQIACCVAAVRVTLQSCCC